VVELTDIHDRVFIPHHCTLIAISIKIIGRRKQCDNCWELGFGMFGVHLISVILSLMGPYDTKEAISVQEVDDSLETVDIGAATSFIIVKLGVIIGAI
jgi:hypothetical protein